MISDGAPVKAETPSPRMLTSCYVYLFVRIALILPSISLTETLPRPNPTFGNSHICINNRNGEAENPCVLRVRKIETPAALVDLLFIKTLG